MTSQPSPDPYGAAPPDPRLPAHQPPGPGLHPPPSYYHPYPYHPYPPPRGTNTMAILALVFAFIIAPAAIVLGHLARRQIRQTGEDGDGMALAGMIVGYVLTGITGLFCVGYLAFLVAFIGAAATAGAG